MEIFSVLCLLVQLFLLTMNIHSLFIMARLKIDDVVQNHLNEKLLMQYFFAWLMGDISFIYFLGLPLKCACLKSFSLCF